MQQEIWRDTEYPNYQVSNLGRVYSVPRISINGRKSVPGKILSWNDNGHGYQTCMITVDGKPKRVYIHRLVAQAFIPNIDNKKEVNHIDGFLDDEDAPEHGKGKARKYFHFVV